MKNLITSAMLFLLLGNQGIYAQQGMMINMAQVDGVDITPDNIFSFQVQSSIAAPNALIKGTIIYRSTGLSVSYSFHYNIRQGLNIINASMVHPQWQFSQSALRELFFNLKKLPAGTYEYCVTIIPNTSSSGDILTGDYQECVYRKSDDVFLLTLLDPENGAKIHEYYPALSWVANYAFVNELTYRIRVADIKQGQNPENAIARNPSVFDERNLMQNTITYPIYAKPLIKDQPYAWTVDAFYKGLLLGSSETWQFTIVDDSLYSASIVDRDYIDIRRENGKERLYISGELKLKYVLNDMRKDTLDLQLINESGKEVKMKQNKLGAVYGDNRYVINLSDSLNLKHNSIYTLKVSTRTAHWYALPFTYLNPLFGR